jgi:ABC-type enterochelin transport system substrate-binding protein
MRNVLFAVCLVALLGGCSSGTTEEQAAAETEAQAPSGPRAEEAVRAFYDHLNAGRESEALALYIEANRTAMSAPDSGFGDWVKEETKGGTLQNVEIAAVTIPGDTVTVPFTLVYQDGSRAQRSVEAYKITGSWQLGSIETR